MDITNPTLPLGYSPLPENCTANLVTCLEMLAPPADRAPLPSPPGVAIERWGADDLAAYRELFLRIGADWLWTSRLLLSDAALRALMLDPRIEVFALRRDGVAVGLLELDFRVAGECEILYFGFDASAIGQGLAPYLMDHAIARAWAQPIRRFWLHTCNFDHPRARAFYQRSGFRPYAIYLEVHPDPRLIGELPRSAAPHVPILPVEE